MNIIFTLLISLSFYGNGYADDSFLFYVTADPQFNNANKASNNISKRTLQVIEKKMSEDRNAEKNVKYLVIQGDITQNSRPYDELEWYLDAIKNFESKVIASVGNHDLMKATWYQSLACKFGLNSCVKSSLVKGALYNEAVNAIRTSIGTLLISRDMSSPFLSWESEGVYFAHVGLAPANLAETGDIYGTNHVLDKLEADLKENALNAKPVILFTHYGFDDFSKNDKWWSEEDRDEFKQVIAPYNVLAIFSGHQHLRYAHKEYTYPILVDHLGKRRYIKTYVTGAALHGVYIKVVVEMTNNNPKITIKRHKIK